MSMTFRPKSIDNLSTSADFQAGLAAGTWYSQYLSLSTLAGFDQLGTEYVGTGSVGSNLWGRFAIVKTTVNLTAGQVVTQAAPTAGTYTLTGSTVAVINTNITASAANSFVGGYLYFETLGIAKPIKANTTGANSAITISLPDATIAGGTVTTATPPFDPDALTAAQLAALSNADALAVQMPFDVRVCTNALVPEGIALGTVTASTGPYTIIQRGGYSLVKCVATSPALTAGVPAFISSTAGSIIGGAGVANAYVSQQIVPRYTYTTSTAILVPCMVNF
jgi:hypothetical protein